MCQVSAVSSIRRKVWGPSPSAEEYPGPDCPSMIVWALDLGEKNYSIITVFFIESGQISASVNSE